MCVGQLATSKRECEELLAKIGEEMTSKLTEFIVAAGAIVPHSRSARAQSAPQRKRQDEGGVTAFAVAAAPSVVAVVAARASLRTAAAHSPVLAARSPLLARGTIAVVAPCSGGGVMRAVPVAAALLASDSDSDDGTTLLRELDASMDRIFDDEGIVNLIP